MDNNEKSWPAAVQPLGSPRRSMAHNHSIATANPDLLKSVYQNLYPVGFNPYAFPARISLAEDHRHATEFGKRVWLPTYSALAQRVCQCCKNFIDTRQFHFWASFHDVGSASPSYALYFYFMIFGIVVLLLNFLLTGISTLVGLPKAREIFLSSPLVADSSDDSPDCDPDFAAQSHIRGLLALLNVIVLIGLKYLFFYFLVRESRSMEDLRVTASVFTLKVRLPGNKSEAEVRADLAAIAAHNLQIVKLNKVYDISDYMELLRSFLLAQKKAKILAAKGVTDGPEHYRVHLRLRVWLGRFDAQRQRFKSAEELDRQFTKIVYVTLASSRQRNLLEQRFRSGLSFFAKKVNGYAARRAPEPADIIWHNYGLNRQQKIVRRLLTHAVSVAVVVINFVIIAVIKVWQLKLVGANENASIPISLVVALVVALTNVLSRVVLIVLTQVERRTLYSSEGSNKVVKVFHTVFFTTALNILVGTYLANALLSAREGPGATPSWGIWIQGGVVTNISVVMLINALTSFIYTLLDPLFLYKVARKYWLLRRVRLDPHTNKVLQCELNEAFEKLEYDLPAQYINLFRAIAVAFFYQAVLPYGLLLGALELLIQLLVQRLFIFTFTLRPRDYDVQFTFQMVAIFQNCVVALGAGYVVFDAIVNCRVTGYAWTVLALAVVDWGLGSVAFFLRIVRRRAAHNHFYASTQSALPTDYDRLNPLTQRKAVERWLKDINVLKRSARRPPPPDADAGINQYLQSEAGFGKGTGNLYPEPPENIEDSRDDARLDLINMYKTQRLVVENRRLQQNLRRRSEHKPASVPEAQGENESDVEALVSHILASNVKAGGGFNQRQSLLGSAEADEFMRVDFASRLALEAGEALAPAGETERHLAEQMEALVVQPMPSLALGGDELLLRQSLTSRQTIENFSPQRLPPRRSVPLPSMLNFLDRYRGGSPGQRR